MLPWYSNSTYQRKTVYDGVIHKCPNCGEELKSFQTICPNCKYELRDLNNSKSVKDFNKKLLQAKNKEEKIQAIKTADISNSREDIFEFMTIASSNFDATYYTNHLSEDDESDAWLSMIEQCYQKGKLSLEQNDLISIKQEYDKIQAKIKNSKIKNIAKKIYPIAFIVAGLLLVLTKITAIGVIGIALAVVGIVILTTNKKNKNLSKQEKLQVLYTSKPNKKGYSSWSTTAKVFWIILNIYTIGIPALIYWCKNKNN